jgi:hypothetical protein
MAQRSDTTTRIGFFFIGRNEKSQVEGNLKNTAEGCIATCDKIRAAIGKKIVETQLPKNKVGYILKRAYETNL